MSKALVAADLRSATEEELNVKLTEAKIELFNLRFQAATGQAGEPRAAACAVRPRARAPLEGDRPASITVKRERELGIVVLERGESADE